MEKNVAGRANRKCTWSPYADTVKHTGVRYLAYAPYRNHSPAQTEFVFTSADFYWWMIAIPARTLVVDRIEGKRIEKMAKEGKNGARRILGNPPRPPPRVSNFRAVMRPISRYRHAPADLISRVWLTKNRMEFFRRTVEKFPRRRRGHHAWRHFIFAINDK